VLKRVFQAGILSYGLAVCGYLLARWIVGERWNWIAFVNNFVPWLAFVALIAGFVALFTRWRWLLLSLQLPILILFFSFYREMLWPRSHPIPNGIEITAANFNIQSGATEPHDILRAIKTLDADILGLEEVSPSDSHWIEQDLAAEYPYRVAFGTGETYGIALLSRYPILSEEVFDPAHGYVRLLRATLDIEGISVMVYLIHPPMPGSTFTNYDAHWRSRYVDMLRKRLAEESGPVLVLCDCNMTDQSDDYRALDDLAIDSFREAGWGMGFTFPNKKMYPRLIRIDYVWHSDHFVAYDAYVADDNGTSDHSPMVAKLVLTF
jgi:endonuclease/exonuclease/phosphatase (EEP) superfamily protein YafD